MADAQVRPGRGLAEVLGCGWLPRVNPADVPLVGGHTAPVFRVGDTVRRVAGPWTPAVASFMTGLRRAGVDVVPAHFGLDEDGREVVAWVDGEVPAYPLPSWAWNDQVLLDVARATRVVHDVAASLVLPRTGWRRPAVEPVETVCHGDLAPYNCAFDGGRLVGLIDWDYAVPGPRLWDLGYLAYRFISLTPPGNRDGRPGSGPPADQWRRVALLCEAYGGVEPVDVVRWAARRLEDLIAYSYAEAAAGNAALQNTIDLGHVRLYEGDLEWVRRLLRGIGSAGARAATSNSESTTKEDP